ncbi:MAG: hypothetical protein VX475_21355 [Myxococcota bacterium]|jgi:F0F1-type ATP synthase membrane subunit c/vacuolar-type H+-ATPase subunit K|nr:hypothetical protein [Myxococcota bacterium]
MSQEAQAPNFQTIVILWAAMFMSCIIYVVISFILQAPEGFELAEDQFNLFLMVFGGMAPVMALLAVFARGFIVKQNLSKLTEPVTIENVMASYQTGAILGWAFTEAISIFGFVIFMLSYKQWVIFPFVGLSSLLFLITFPRKSQVQSYLEEYGSSAGHPSTKPPSGTSW